MSDTVVHDDGLPERIGRYEIRGLIGRGSLGPVYRGYDPPMDREVAIKVLSPQVSANPAARERFLREARAGARLDHPNICRLFDAGTDGDHTYLAMELLSGRPLSAVLAARSEPVSLPRALQLVRTVALAVEAAHRVGIVHRDLKPANVMMEPGNRVVVIGFGSLPPGAVDDASSSGVGLVGGTPAYMSPEQATAKRNEIGAPADVWALGVMLYELLAGQPPFRGGAYEVLAQVVTVTPRPPSDVRAGTDPRLDALVLRALAKKPADRPTARELADALEDFLRGSAAPPAAMAAPPTPPPAARARAVPPDPPTPQTMAPGPVAAFAPPPAPRPRMSASMSAPPPAARAVPPPARSAAPPSGAGWLAQTVEALSLSPDSAAEIPRAVTRRATVRYYSRMSPGRLFPLLVVLSAEQIAEVRQKAVKQAESAGFQVEPDSLLELEPVLPGCDCYPPRESLPVAPEPVTATFYVVPHVLGRVEGARVVVRQGGRILSEVPLDVKVRKQTLAVLCGLLSLAAPYLMMGLKSMRLDYESQKADGFPVYQRAAGWALENVRPEYAGFGLVGLAVVAYLAMRPRKRNVFWDIAPKPVRSAG